MARAVPVVIDMTKNKMIRLKCVKCGRKFAGAMSLRPTCPTRGCGGVEVVPAPRSKIALFVIVAVLALSWLQSQTGIFWDRGPVLTVGDAIKRGATLEEAQR